MAGITRDYRCGYCLCSYDEMTDPRVLPCDHAFCASCLKADLQIRQKIKCPICKKSPTVEDVDSLDPAELAETDGSQKMETRKCPCDCCERNTAAVCFCETCGLKYCAKHEEIHKSLIGVKHVTATIAKYLATPGRYQTQMCTEHAKKELSVSCENCLKVLCVECELADTNKCTSSPSGNGAHVIRSFSYMLEKLTTQYEKAAKRLADKNKEIYRLEKIVWRQLGDVTDNGEKMIEKIDAVTEEQVDAIREASEVLKHEIRTYLKERKIQAEEYTVELLKNQEKVEAAQREIAVVLQETPIAELIVKSKERQQRLTEATQMVLPKCYLEERVLATKKQCRELELRMKCTVPSIFTYATAFKIGNVPNSIAFIGEGRVVVGIPAAIQLQHPYSGSVTTTISCSGLLKVAVSGDKVYALRNVDNTKVVKIFSADLQSNSDLTTVPSGVTDISVTDHFILLADNATKTLIVYNLDGDLQHELHLPPATNILSILALADGTALVSSGQVVSRYRLGGNADPIWTCSGMSNVTAMCHDKSSRLVVCGNTNYSTINFLSLGGHLLKSLNIPSCLYTNCSLTPQPVSSICVQECKLIVAGNLYDGELIKNIAMPAINPSYGTSPQPLNSICVVDEMIIAVGNLNEHSRGTH